MNDLHKRLETKLLELLEKADEIFTPWNSGIYVFRFGEVLIRPTSQEDKKSTVFYKDKVLVWDFDYTNIEKRIKSLEIEIQLAEQMKNCLQFFEENP